MSVHPKTAMILAAGLGTRMRPLTDHTPKPLLKVANKRIIDYGLNHLNAAGVETAVVNKHYLPDQIEAWAKQISSPKIVISDETDQVLETGGGVKRALPVLGTEPFYVLNSDCFWTDHGTPALERLAQSWDNAIMDCLLLLCDPKHTTGYDGSGDFVMDAEGRLKRQTQNGLCFIGAYLVHPRLFENAPAGRFSMNVLWNEAIANQRLFGISHQGHWLHVGTPDAIKAAEDYLAKS